MRAVPVFRARKAGVLPVRGALICCAVMIAAGILFARSLDLSGRGSLEVLFLVLPIVGCLVMHLTMHRTMGGACHETETRKDHLS